MLSEISSAYPIIFTIIWQSTLFVAAGLMASYFCKRHPARAHQVLFLSMIAAVAVPFMTLAVKHLDLGIFTAEPEPAVEYVATREVGVQPYDVPLPDFILSVSAEPKKLGLPWNKILLAGWGAASVILLVRLILIFIIGIRLVKKAHPFKYPRIAESIKVAGSKLGIKENIVAHCSKSVSSPVIWCWKRRPILLLPSDKRVLNDKIDLVGILCHELAHLKRRDHVAGLLSEFMVVFLPWHPLLWWAKKRLLSLSEHACDDWVIVAGGCGTNYAESLLDLVPAKQMAFVQAVVRNKNVLKGRVIRMLKERYGNPRLSKKWILSVVLITTCITLTVAFAQTRSARSDVVDSTPQQDISNEQNNPMGTEQEIKEKTEPVVQRFFDAYKAQDFEGMCKDFSKKMLEALPAKEFEEDNKRDLSTYGEMVSWDYAGWVREGEFDIVRVHVNYTKGDTVQYEFVFDKGPDGNKISGLWKRPLPKEISKTETDALVNQYGSIMESHLKALKKKDFEAARSDFSSAMLDALSPEKLDQTMTDLKIGNLESWKFDHANREGEFINLYYLVTFAEGETLTYTFVFKEGASDKKIEGLWISPLAVEEEMAPVSELKEITLPVKTLEQYVGTYELMSGINMMITVEDEQLMAQMTGQIKGPLFASSETQFFSKEANAVFDFNKDDKGAVTSLTLHQNGMKTNMPRISDKVEVQERKKIELSEKAMNQLTGKWTGKLDYVLTVRFEKDKSGDFIGITALNPDYPIINPVTYLSLSEGKLTFKIGGGISDSASADEIKQYSGVVPEIAEFTGELSDNKIVGVWNFLISVEGVADNLPLTLVKENP